MWLGPILIFSKLSFLFFCFPSQLMTMFLRQHLVSSKSVLLAWPLRPEDGLWFELLPRFLNTTAFSLLHPMAQSSGLISHPQLVRFIFQKKAKLFICVNSALGTHKLTERKQSHILSFQNGPSVLLQEDLPPWGPSSPCLT